MINPDKKSWGARLLIGIPGLWLFLFFLAPFAMVVAISFSTARIGIPPYDFLVAVKDEIVSITLNLENFLYIFSSDTYLIAAWTSIRIAAISTVITLLIAYPLAYGIASVDRRYRNFLVFLIIIPFWSSMLIRVYSWIAILRNDGLLNNFLMNLGLIHEPLVILNTEIAVFIGIVYTYLPFMVLPLYSTLSVSDRTLIEAAQDLGCSRIKAFWRITVPLSMPGIIAGCALVFIPAIGEFVIPDLLGGADTNMIGRAIWIEFFNNRDWPLTAAVTVVLLGVLIIPISIMQMLRSRQSANGGK